MCGTFVYPLVDNSEAKRKISTFSTNYLMSELISYISYIGTSLISEHLTQLIRNPIYKVPEIHCQHFYLHLLMLIYSLFELLSTHHLLLSTHWQNPHLFLAKKYHPIVRISIFHVLELLSSKSRNLYIHCLHFYLHLSSYISTHCMKSCLHFAFICYTHFLDSYLPSI